VSTDIVCERLTKEFGERRAVDGLTFRAQPGILTGFVGANGAGKTTTIRMLLGLVEPSAGRALVGGRRYGDLDAPRHRVGAVLDTPGAHPGHTGRAHLQIAASAAGIDLRRVEDLLDLVELTEHAGRRVATYSLGMKQRLSLAAALLGDPPIMILDEPTKGLDPPGIRWLHALLRAMADEGRCVLMSSHHLAELAAITDHVVLIDRGRLVADSAIGDLLRGSAPAIVARTPTPDALAAAIRIAGGSASPRSTGELLVTGLSAEQVGEIAATASVRLHGLSERRADLEQVFFGLTSGGEKNGHAPHDR
jgi:ABC-2 type transport system ATP-binding protein